MNLEHNVAVVTAAGRGIGRGIAVALARAGADIVVNGYGEATTRATVQAVEAAGARALAFPADATDPDRIQALIDATLETFGHVDILVNNVGGGPKGGFERAEGPLERAGAIWDGLYSQNLRPAVLATEAVTPHFEAQHAGKIVNISSIAGRASLSAEILGTLVPPAYGAMKAALAHYTQTCAELLGRYNVNVNAVCPGIVYTDAWAGNSQAAVKAFPEFEGLEPRDWFERFARGDYPHMLPRTPLRREQSVEDIANAVCFLASEAAANITGQSLMVDSGLVKL